MKKLAVSFLCLSLAGPVMAQNKNANAPIEVSADSFVADLNAKSGTYSGNVLVKQGDINLTANSIRVNVTGSKPDKIYASGNVVVKSPTGTISGDAGVYDVAPRLITMTGKVVLIQGKIKQTTNALTYNLSTGQAKFGVAATATGGRPGQPGTRVHTTFTPAPPSKPAPTP